MAAATADPKRWPLVEVTDPSVKRGIFTVWAVCDPTDHWFVVRAARIPDASFVEMADNIKAERGYLGRAPQVAIMDQRGGQWVANKDLELTWFQRFAELGLHYLPSQDTPMQALHEWLRPVWDPQTDKAVPKLRICQSVADMKEGPLWGLMRFVWDPVQTKQWQYRQAGKDWVDCLRYLSGFPGLTYKQLIGKTEYQQPGISDTYQSRPAASAAGLARMLPPTQEQILRGYSTRQFRRRW